MDDIKKIAIIFPHTHRGGILSYAKNIVCMLKSAAEKTRRSIQIILYCLEDFYDIKNEFEDLLSQGVKVREFSFKVCSYQEVNTILRFQKNRRKLPALSEFYIIDDNFQNALDCDFWFLVSDRCKYPLAPLRPYAVLLHDFIQRYLPEMFGEWYEESYIQTARNADFVMTTIPETNADVENYAGIPKNRIICTGLQFDPQAKVIAEVTQKTKDLVETMTPYCIWPTNTSMHKNSFRTLHSIAQYYAEGGHCKVIVTGPYTERFDPTNDIQWKSEDWDPVRILVSETPFLQENVTFCGNLPHTDYLYILQNAKFLLHAALFDNGNLALLEAAYLGIPSMSSDYPQTRYYDKEFNLHLYFFNQYSENSITQALHKMASLYEEHSARLPAKATLLKNSYHSPTHSLSLWTPIEKILWPSV